jgi:hypothetical protein
VKNANLSLENSRKRVFDQEVSKDPEYLEKSDFKQFLKEFYDKKLQNSRNSYFVQEIQASTFFQSLLRQNENPRKLQLQALNFDINPNVY